MLKVEFQYVNKCPRVKEMAKNIDVAFAQIDFEVEFIENVINDNNNFIEGLVCPTLLIDGRDLVGKLKCDQNKPYCRNYINGITTAEEIKKFIEYSY